MFINGVEIPYLITNAVEITQAEYDALQDKSGTYIIEDAQSVPLGASSVTYDNTISGLASTVVQGAIDEVASSVDDIDTSLTDIIASTLSAGATTVSFSDARITADSIIEPYVYFAAGTETTMIAPTSFNVTSGTCVLTFDAQDADTIVGIRVF